MCDPTYPVVRTGSILKASRVLSASAAVQTAEWLFSKQADLTGALIAALGRIPDVDKIVPVEDDEAIRVRVVPALTIDFRPIGFAWKGESMELRPCLTVCSGKRRAKLWIRYNFKDIQEDKRVVAPFFKWVEEWNTQLHDICIDFYNRVLSEGHRKVQLERTYSISIKLLSVQNPALKDELDREFLQIQSRSPQQASNAYDLLVNTIENDCGLTLANKELDGDTLLVGFRYPRTRIEGDAPASLPQLQDSPPLAGEDFGALCIVDHDVDHLRITGVAHEARPPKSYRRSATHIISGEISGEVGNVY